MFSLICVWINDGVNNREAGDVRRYLAHYDVIVIVLSYLKKKKECLNLHVENYFSCPISDWQLNCAQLGNVNVLSTGLVPSDMFRSVEFELTMLLIFHCPLMPSVGLHCHFIITHWNIWCMETTELTKCENDLCLPIWFTYIVLWNISHVMKCRLEPLNGYQINMWFWAWQFFIKYKHIGTCRRVMIVIRDNFLQPQT